MSTLFAVAGVTSLIASIKSLINVSRNMINVTSHFEQTRKGLETVLQSAEKGSALFEKLRKFSFETTFGVDELASASTQLLNIGVSTDELNQKLKMLGDLAQGDKNKFAELTSIYAKVLSTGKAGAMQLNQFALRGIPIRQLLKDMGVEGAVSAETLTQAFEQLTGEGGKFHNAMGNIIDTIEGKRGFIADTLKEIAVNMGEVTGITKNYKKWLDTLYEVLNKFNNALMKINQNPVLKAIIEGTLFTAIGGLAGMIVNSLVPAITTKLLPALKSLVVLATANPWLLGIGLAVGATVGVISAINNNREETLVDKKKEEVAELADAYESAMQRIDTAEETYADQIAKREYEIAKLELEKLKNSNTLAPYFDNEIAKLQQEVDLIKQINSGLAQEKKERDSILQSYKDMVVEMNEEFNAVYAIAHKIYESTPEGQLKRLREERDRIQAKLDHPFLPYEYTDENGDDIFSWVEISEDKLHELQVALEKTKKDIKALVDEQNKISWQSWFETVTGVKVTSTGRDAGKTYAQNIMDSIFADAKEFTSVEEGMTNLSRVIEKVKNDLTELKEKKGLDEAFTDKDGSIQEMTGLLATLEKMLEELKKNGKIDIDFDVKGKDQVTSLSELADKLKNKGVEASEGWSSFAGVGSYALGELISAGEEILNTDVKWGKYLTSFINTFMATGNVWMALIDVGVMGILDWASSLKGEEQDQVALLKQLNQQYEALFTAQKEAEEYYLEQRRKLNAQAYIGDLTRVNDMILTPQGNFSTSPQDYLIATKNPASLSGGMVLNVQIKNELGDSANVSVQQKQNADGTNDMFVLISRKVASDYANGYNGWENAVTARQTMGQGRRVSF